MKQEHELELAHSRCTNNKADLKSSCICGCFFCLNIFKPKEIEEYIEVDTPIDYDGTAICPYCGVDSVIPESAGFPITRDFLAKMQRRWFNDIM